VRSGRDDRKGSPVGSGSDKQYSMCGDDRDVVS